MLALILVATAYAGVPVALPPGEPVDAWAEAAALAGLTPGPLPADGPWVRLTAGASAWTIEARGRDGQLHRTTVAPPTSEAQREDALALAASLVETSPVALSTPLLPLPAPAPAPAPDHPARARSSATKPAASSAPGETLGATGDRAATGGATIAPGETPGATAGGASAAGETPGATGGGGETPGATGDVAATGAATTAPGETPGATGGGATPVLDEPIVLLDDPDPPGGGLSPWLSASVGGSVRGAPSAGLGLSAGAAWPRVLLGLSTATTSPTSLPSLGERRRFTETSAAARVAWRGPLEAGASLGVAFRSFSQQDEAVARTRTPFAASDVGWPIQLAGAWTLLPTAWAAADVAPTSLSVGAADLGHLPPVSAGLSLALRISPSAGDPSGRPGGLPAR